MSARTPAWRALLFVGALVSGPLGAGCDNGRLISPPGAGGGAGAGIAGMGSGGVRGDIGGNGGATDGGPGGVLGGGGEIGGGAGGDAAGNGGDHGAGGAPACLAPPPPVDSAMVGCPTVPFAPLGEAMHPNEGQTHLVLCSTTCYGTNPPSSGNHYPVWPVYKTYDAPVPWGFLVHGLEHGSIIVSYNCPCGCADEVAAAQAWIDALPTDADCGAPPRVLMAPDPGLDVRWAASAWQWTLREQGFDPAVFQAFFTAHYNRAPEEICGGVTDGSATGWCQ